MIDPVELRALVEKIGGTNPQDWNDRTIAFRRLDALAPTLARQVLALSDEVGRLKALQQTDIETIVKMTDLATAKANEADRLKFLLPICGTCGGSGEAAEEPGGKPYLCPTCGGTGRIQPYKDRATAAESEAQALRERMGEIERIATDAGRETRGVNLIPATEFLSIEDTRTLAREATVNFDRIAALSTTPKEKEG